MTAVVRVVEMLPVWAGSLWALHRGWMGLPRPAAEQAPPRPAWAGRYDRWT